MEFIKKEIFASSQFLGDGFKKVFWETVLQVLKTN